MNYLLVMPQVTKINEQQYMFPSGIAYVSASLKSTLGVKKRKVFTLNLNYKEDSLHNILKEYIESNAIDALATGGLTAQYPQIKEIIDTARIIKPTIKIIVGSGLITSDPIAAMQALEIADYGIVGEGEITICELADALENNKEIETVDGLVYKKSSEWILTNPRAEIMDLDSLPFPDYEGFEFGELLKRQSLDLYGFDGGNTATVTFGRSCPFNCTFCFHTSGSKYRQRSLDSIFQELDFLVSKYPLDNLVIADELFAYNKAYVEEFCQRVQKYKFNFCVTLRVDIADKKLLQMLKDSGCLSVGFGLESADNKILKSMRKHITVEQIENALALASEVGLLISGCLIFGDLEETYETAMNTINWRLAHLQYTIAMNWIIVFPGSHLYEVACEKGIIKDRVQYIKDGCPYINVSKMSDEEYHDIATKIDTLSLERTDFLLDVAIKSLEFGKAEISGKCPVCQQEICFANLDVFKPLTNRFCTHCKKSFNILVADYIDDTLEKNISELLKNAAIAIWPITIAAGNMLRKAPSLYSEDVYFVDSSPYKQGNGFMGKITNSPDIIRQNNIEIVCLPVTSSVAHDVVNAINKKYPSVKYIVYSGELINPAFQLSKHKI